MEMRLKKAYKKVVWRNVNTVLLRLFLLYTLQISSSVQLYSQLTAKV